MAHRASERTKREGDARQGREGRGDCIVCVKQHPDGLGLEVRQVVEGLAHHRNRRRVDIPILIAVRNPHDVPVAMRVVHRAFVKASLKQFRFRSAGSAAKEGWEDRYPSRQQLMSVIRALFSLLRREDPVKPGAAMFLAGISCVRVLP